MTHTTERPTFLEGAEVVRHDIKRLNKTLVRFKVRLKNTTKSNSPKWSQVIKSEGSAQESDLLKIKRSEIGLRGIKVFKALEEAASLLRQELKSISEWCIPDLGDLVCNVEMAPLVWSELLRLRDETAPRLRRNLLDGYENGLSDYTNRVSEFVSASAWNLSDSEQASVIEALLENYPTIEMLEEYLSVEIGCPIIHESLSQQLSSEQAECLNQIQAFKEAYESNFEQRLIEAATIGAESVAAELLRELATWEPGRKPVQFQNKLEKHLKKLQILAANASDEANPSISSMLENLNDAIRVAIPSGIANAEASKSKNVSNSELQRSMNEIRARLMGDQAELKKLCSTEGMSLGKAAAMSMDW
jgi:archaellum component FlaC